MKKKITIFMAIMLLVTLAIGPIANALSSVTSATLHLTQTEGTVTVNNANGRALSTSDGMRLYSGYAVATARRSHAYISLADSRAVKLDTNSSSDVRSSGGRLELLLTSGNMFFNVTTPVANNAELNIRTSTTVTGIRGTAGVVKVIDEITTIVYLFTGTVTVQVFDPFTELTTEATIHAGQRLTSTDMIDSDGKDYVDVRIDYFTEYEVDPFAADEIRKDQALQREITEQTDLSVPIIIGDVDARLRDQYDAEDARQREIDDELSRLDNTVIDPVFTDPGEGGVVGGGPPGIPSLTISGYIDATLPGNPFANAIAANPGGAIITYSGPLPLDALYIPGSVTIPPGFTVIISPGSTLDVDTLGILYVQGSLNNDGNAVNSGIIQINGSGTMTNTGYISNSGTIQNYSASTFINSGAGTIATMLPTARIVNGDGGANPGRMVLGGGVPLNIDILVNDVGSTLEFTNTGGPSTIADLDNFGALTITGSPMQNLQVNNLNNRIGSSCTMTGAGTLTIIDIGGASTVQNLGTMTIDAGYTMVTALNTNLTNGGSGTLTVGASAFLTLNSDGLLSSLVNTDQATLNIYGTVTINGTPANPIINDDGGLATPQILVSGSAADIHSNSTAGAIFVKAGTLTIEDGATVNCVALNGVTVNFDSGYTLSLRDATIKQTNGVAGTNIALAIGAGVAVDTSGTNYITAAGSAAGTGIFIEAAVGIAKNLSGLVVTSTGPCINFGEGGGEVHFSGTNILRCTDATFLESLLVSSNSGVAPSVYTAGTVNVSILATGVLDAEARMYSDIGVTPVDFYITNSLVLVNNFGTLASPVDINSDGYYVFVPF